VKVDQIVRELEDVARKLGVEVRNERGHFRGGLCSVDEHPVIVLNRRQPAEARLAILAESLRDLPVETVFMRPAVRQALEASWSISRSDVSGPESEASPAE
jgi:hypothetical protein